MARALPSQTLCPQPSNQHINGTPASPRFTAQIALDKPPITEKLTNA